MTALVGPLKVIRYAGHTKRAYDLPRDTLDVRYRACGNHHPACDCREATWAEWQAEVRSEIDTTVAAFNEVLAGHSTYPPDELHALGGPSSGMCLCTGCVIARRSHFRYFESLDLHEAARRARRARGKERPF